MEYMSCPEAAEKWGISERRVQILCKENRIQELPFRLVMEKRELLICGNIHG